MAGSGCLKWMKRGCFTVFALAIVGVGGAYLYVRHEFSQAGSTLEADLTALRALNVATEPADLTKLTEVPIEDNAAPIYRQAISLKSSMGRQYYESHEQAFLGLDPKPRLEADPAPPTREQAEQVLSGLIEIIEKAAAKRDCYWNRDWSQGFYVLFPEYADLKSFAKLLCAKAQRLAMQGKVDEAFEEVRLAQRIGAHASREPVLISGLVGIAIDSLAIAAWRDVLDGHRSDPDAIQLAGETVRSFVELPGLRYAMMGEVVCGRIGIRNLRSVRDIASDPFDEDKRLPYKTLEEKLVQDPLIKSGFEGKFVAAYRRLFENWPKDPLDAAAHNANFRALDRSAEADGSMTGILNRIFFPVFDQAANAYVRDEAQRRLAKASAWVLAWKAKTGQFPDSLPSGERDMIDPFTGQNLNYVQKPDGFIVYSVGVDGKDNDGKPRWAPRTGDEYDDVMAFPKSLLPAPSRYPGAAARAAMP